MNHQFFRILFWIFFLLFFFIGLTNGRNILKDLGIIKDQVLIAGTGSMYPTFPKGEGKTDLIRAQETVAWPYMRRYSRGISLFGNNLFGYDIQRGDIVDFENSKTDEITRKQYGESAAFVKRVIALPGDTIELKDGFVYLNGQTLKEPYTASARSTYGGETLADCQKLTVPPNMLFVMGDNRKGSLDSRFTLGLIHMSDVQHILPLPLQGPYEKNWRSTDNDEKYANQPTLVINQFVDLVNQKRKAANISSLKYNTLLAKSAEKRAQIMLSTDDFSIEASKSGYTLVKSISDSGYDNILSAETLARGYYDSNELLDNLYQFPDTKKLVLDSRYQDIGISAVVGSIDSCPIQVIVVHLGGYIPPAYSKEEIASWQKLDNTLEEVISSWEKLRSNPNIDQNTLQKLLESFALRKSNADKIVYKLTHNLWLTKEEQQMVKEDQKLSEEENTYINQLKQ